MESSTISRHQQRQGSQKTANSMINRHQLTKGRKKKNNKLRNQPRIKGNMRSSLKK
ncbi:unnamed protein product [Meloidogyne enterolobii]|uniref:Uncharacterized protein n=1 Tax=Meloidogyne enterolobii TaxID=390850 RepID=A0ACB0Z0I7_MELEN